MDSLLNIIANSTGGRLFGGSSSNNAVLLTSLAVVGTSLVAYLVLHTIVQWYRLSHIPGPKLAAFSKYWMVRESVKLRFPQAVKELNDKHGPLVRVGPNDIVTNDPEVLRKMMVVRSPYTRGPWYDAWRLNPTRDNLFSMRDDVAHTALRNKMVAGYSGKENLSMETTIETEIARLIDLIERKYISTSTTYRPMDFGQKAQYFTLDVISDLAFGQPLGYLEKDDDVYDYIKITTASIPAMLTLGCVPTLANLLQSRFLRFLLPKETDKIGFGAFIGVTNKVVAQRFSKDAAPQPDMLGSFMRHGLNLEEAQGEAILQVVAGSDTSASTIRAVMLHLLSNPPAYKKLQAEIDEAIATGKISSPIKDSEARNLPYLQACIREGLRILPPAGGAFFKEVPKGGDVLCGVFVPGGTQVGVSCLAIHHDKKTYGEDAELYRPERWLDEDEDRVEKMRQTVDMVFHYGKWQCPGRTVALMEFNKIFVELLRRFEFSTVNPTAAAKITNAGVWMFDDFWVRVTRRGSE
ncbi:Pisatin demethylase [Podospora australis]|uniref:Cytochrome P450 monooxygenase ABA1 n=1 Tax=Podospora australis TaxID=1536484 RepID=A0AAN6WLF2_9PEZI|nr:Pisatin demethylase [Podospora australis]